MIFKYHQSEEYYRKLLLLSKIKRESYLFIDKQYIFDKGYCWDILLKDKNSPWLCCNYARNVLNGEFPEGEHFINKNEQARYSYLNFVLKKRYAEYYKS